ncbi:unnamed protein product [Brugia timori]|uniref:LITAF domain-containing protein n=1 Tax=Brugia timori TaxID=42155 RepID=A0A0R3QF30_9BILA|nr:unnamed protein product [Brugia timori]
MEEGNAVFCSICLGVSFLTSLIGTGYIFQRCCALKQTTSGIH